MAARACMPFSGWQSTFVTNQSENEPTGNLDAQSATDALTMLSRLNKEFDKTIVMVTHDPHAARFASKIRGSAVKVVESPKEETAENSLRRARSQTGHASEI